LPSLCAEAANGGVRLHGNGENLLAVLYIDNLVAALISAATAKNAPGNAYYVADNDVLTAREFLDQLCRACGLSGPRRGVFTIDLAVAWLRERVIVNTGLVSAVVHRGRGTLFDVQAAVRDLDFAPKVAVDEGMRALGQWVKAQGGPSAVAKLCRPYVDAQSVDEQMRRADQHAGA
jgi:nucleoside-diphosphate-sugar epimerase